MIADAVVNPDLVVLGNLLVDDVVLPDGRTRMGEPGGATLYASLGAALWGLRTGLVSFRAEGYPGWALEALRERGVDLAGVHAVLPGVDFDQGLPPIFEQHVKSIRVAGAAQHAVHGRDDFLGQVSAELDVHTAASLVRGNGDRAKSTRTGNDLRFFGVTAGVEDLVGHTSLDDRLETRAEQPPEAWQRLTLREGEKGLLVADYLQTPVWVWDGEEETARCWHLLVRREVGADTVSHYCLSNAPLDTTWQELARVQAQRFFIEHSFREAKSECGMADYQVRRWDAWHHHMAQVML